MGGNIKGDLLLLELVIASSLVIDYYGVFD